MRTRLLWDTADCCDFSPEMEKRDWAYLSVRLSLFFTLGDGTLSNLGFCDLVAAHCYPARHCGKTRLTGEAKRGNSERQETVST